jgi:hypothetical protein
MIVKGKAYEENIVLNKNELAKCFAPRKYEIKEAMAELRWNKELPLKNAGYKPNYEKIKNVYASNAAELLKLEAQEEKKRNKISAVNDDNTSIYNNNNTDIVAVPPPPPPIPPIDIINNLYVDMLKQIILCGYKHTDFNLTSTDSALSLFVVVTKKRKKVRRVLTNREQQQRSSPIYPCKPANLDPLVIDENNIYNPDDDEEEREERRKLEEQRILWEQQITKWEQEVAVAFMEEENEIGSQLSDLLTQLPKRFIESKETSDDIKLGLEIADKIYYRMSPELGLTYEQLALDLFPKLRTKEQEGVEFQLYIQRIVRAIDAVQVYIISCFFRKRTIRIFPVALPSKRDNVERVFNGYKKKYVDKVLCEFITIK